MAHGADPDAIARVLEHVRREGLPRVPPMGTAIKWFVFQERVETACRRLGHAMRLAAKIKSEWLPKGPCARRRVGVRS